MDSQVQQVINSAIDRVNEVLPSGEQLPKDNSTVLLGAEAVLDSMGFVNFVASLEEEMESQLGIQICLTDELALCPGSDCTIGSLFDLLSARRQTGPAGGSAAQRP